MTLLQKPCYKLAPVRSFTTLGEILRLTEKQLQRLVPAANKHYRYAPQKKKDGSPRDTWDAHPQLKRVQELINRRFLKNVSYPLYLQGGIRDREEPRDYVRNVGIHAGSACAVALDIADFFPSITFLQVQDVWQRFFRFPEEIAVALTKLTCKDGSLPQGAKTSNYLANLIFWQNEQDLVIKLEEMGWKYSRLTDDITISKTTQPEEIELQKVCGIVIHFIQSYGFHLKREKLHILWQSKQMVLNGLIANAHPALSKVERNLIRGKIRWLSQSIHNQTPVEVSQLHHIIGKLGKLKRLHKRQGVLLRKMLPEKIEPAVNLIKTIN